MDFVKSLPVRQFGVLPFDNRFRGQGLLTENLTGFLSNILVARRIMYLQSQKTPLLRWYSCSCRNGLSGSFPTPGKKQKVTHGACDSLP